MSFDNKYFENESVWNADRVFQNSQELRRFDITKKCIPTDVKSMLDVGCGNGAFMYYLEKDNMNISLKGLESSKVAIENKISESEIIMSDIENMNIRDLEYDMVSALEVLEHMSYHGLSKACEEMKRIASKYILISVPYNEKRVFASCPKCSCKFSPIYHLRSFNDQTLESLFDSFTLVKKKFVMIDSFLFAEDLRKLNYEYRIKWEQELRCPQCGYFNDKHTGDKKINHIERENPAYIKLIKKLIPKKKRPHWVVCLYERS